MKHAKFVGKFGHLSLCAGLCWLNNTSLAQDYCAAPGPCVSCAPQVSRAPAQAPQAQPSYVTVQRMVMQQESVMVPMTVMVPQVVYRQRAILEQVPAAPVAAPAPPSQFIPPPPAPPAEAPALPAPAPALAPNRDCAGSPSTQLALMALMMTNNRSQASVRQPAAAPNPELQARVTNLEAKMDRLIMALEKTR